MLLNSCSNQSKFTNLADKQGSAIKKVDASNSRIKAKTSSYFTQIQFDLEQPNPEKTIPVALQLATLGLQLTGAPTESEATLQKEVLVLLSNQKANQNLIGRLQLDGKTLLLDNQNLVVDRDKKTAQLDTAGKIIAQDADTFTKLKWWFWGVVVFVGFMVLLRLFFALTATGAAIAAKIP